MNPKLKRQIKRITDIRFKEHVAFPWIDFKQEKPLYVIRFFYGEGLLSMLYSACGQAYHASVNGYIPYVDMAHFRTQYYKGRNNNVWEEFFTQPKEYQNYMSKFSYKKILSCFSPPDFEEGNLFTQHDFARYSDKKRIFDIFFSINEEIRKEVDILAEELGISECIGLYARGTDYASLKPTSHNIQPTLDELIKKCSEFIMKYNQKVFVVTEDEKIYSSLKDRFGTSIISFPNDIHFDTNNERKPLYRSLHDVDRIDVAKVYLKKILLLSKCKYLIGGKTNGSLWACIFNDEKYEDICLFDKGIY